jgi:glycosyltransferase involved in cell wall biosynthesis
MVQKELKNNDPPRFFYLIPSQGKGRLDGESRFQHLRRLLFRGKRQLPSGGVKIIYQHCDILNKRGYEAYPVHLGDFIVDWFPHKTKAIGVDEAIAGMRETDILICPEITPAAAAPFPCKRKIIFVQNWALVSIATGPDKKYEDFGFDAILTCSNYISKYMETRSDLPCYRVINGIDLEKFYPDTNKRMERKVLYLNRRNVADAREAIEMLDPALRQRLNIVELENRYSQDEMAEFYRESDIFISIGYPEGFALPPLEAMASGSAVIGFTGGGGLEHMVDGETALVVPDGASNALSDALSCILTDMELKEKIRKGGLEKAASFSMKRMEDELMDFVENCKNDAVLSS